ncbi:MAG: hypothetical protein JSV45_08155 [Chromatiales bacterium]|nr:MAG: hypothetical protein JSV45_08155 [Chromatiales bacterium]
MKPIIAVSVVSITLAFLLYTIAAFRNWRLKMLTTAHLVIIWVGLACDMLATRMMAMSVKVTSWDFHTISGYTALALMAILAVVGTWAKRTDREAILSRFHFYLAPVWVYWLVAYATGVWTGMQRV